MRSASPCWSSPVSPATKAGPIGKLKRAQDAGSQFSQALQDSTDAAKAHEILTGLAQSGPEGYRVLARFQLAAAEAKAGEADKAVADYDALAVDPGVDSILQGHASLQAAALRLEKADMAEMERRLKPLTDSGSPWQFSARELLGLTAYRLNDMREAERSSARWSAIRELRRICGSAPT